MEQIIIKHLSGSRANQVDAFPLAGVRELIFGRDPASNVKFDPDGDDLVGRQHARLIPDPTKPGQFQIVDLNSRNGTFLNRQRIYGASTVQHGDRIQLGAGGPEFSFEIDPPPPPSARPTRLVEPYRPVPPTRESASSGGAAIPPGMAGPLGMPNFPPPRPVGPATVERMLVDVTSKMKGESRRNLWAALMGIAAILLAGAGFFIYERNQNVADREARLKEYDVAATERQRLAQAMTALANSNRLSREGQEQQMKALQQRDSQLASQMATLAKQIGPVSDHGNGGLRPVPSHDGEGPLQPDPLGTTSADTLPDKTPQAIGEENSRSVIFIEVSWRLNDSRTGQQVYLYRTNIQSNFENALNNNKDEKIGKILSDLKDLKDKLTQGGCYKDGDPVFVRDERGKLVPMLSTLSQNGVNDPIVGSYSGSGFITSNDGFFLTNRHVLYPWKVRQNTLEFLKEITRNQQGPKPIGVEVTLKGHLERCVTLEEFPTDWVPEEGSPIVKDTPWSTNGDLEFNPVGSSPLKGDYLELSVVFSKTKQHYKASAVIWSDASDVALGKVEIPESAQRVEIFNGPPDAIKFGQQVVVMGYPGVSMGPLAADAARDLSGTRMRYEEIQAPTLTQGPISKVIPDGRDIRGVDGAISAGHLYQLGINTTGAGNSGGPVFDSKGRVIAIFTLGTPQPVGGAMVTWAVPIQYGLDLIRNKELIR